MITFCKELDEYTSRLFDDIEHGQRQGLDVGELKMRYKIFSDCKINLDDFRKQVNKDIATIDALLQECKDTFARVSAAFGYSGKSVDKFLVVLADIINQVNHRRAV